MLLGRVFMTVKPQKVLRWRTAGLRVAPGWRQPHETLETDATLLVTLGELDTEELGSSKTKFVHNSKGNNNNNNNHLLQLGISVQPQQ